MPGGANTLPKLEALTTLRFLAAFHVVLSEAFDQEAKIAWKVNDLAAIEAATRNALVEASTALHLDPGSTAARMKVSGLQDKLVGLAVRRPPPQ